jgi:hypothetical protein
MVCDISWKALDEGYNVALDRISIRGLLAMLRGSKVAGVSTWAIYHLGEKSFGCGPHGEV